MATNDGKDGRDLETLKSEYIGLTADSLLLCEHRVKENNVRCSTHLGQDEQGLIVIWHYADCDIELRRRDGQYRVYSVTSRSEETCQHSENDLKT